MQKNTFSLFNGNWMFAQNGHNVLIPHLLQILKGKSVEEFSALNSTAFNFNSLNNKDLISASKLEDQQQVVVVSMHHPIFKYDQTCGPKGTQSVMDMMETWKNDSNIVGILFDVNSPGGQASGNSEFANYIKSYPKPTVTFTKDIIGSAAYYFASATDYIIASPYSDFIGSVGSMHYSVNMQGVIEKAGGTINEIYSELSPEKNIQSRALKEGDKQPLLNKVLNPKAQEFHNDVLKFRPQVTSQALKGDVFNPTEALEQGLIDALGTKEDAISKVLELADTNPNSNSNLNNNMNTKERPNVQAVLELDGPMASNDNGTYLNDAQLDVIESTLANNAAAVASAQEAQQTAETNLTQEQQAN